MSEHKKSKNPFINAFNEVHTEKQNAFSATGTNPFTQSKQKSHSQVNVNKPTVRKTSRGR